MRCGCHTGARQGGQIQHWAQQPPKCWPLPGGHWARPLPKPLPRGPEEAVAHLVQTGCSRSSSGLSACTALCQRSTERNGTTSSSSRLRRKFLPGKQPLFPAGHQQCPGGAQKGAPTPQSLHKQTAAIWAPNLFPCHDTQEKGPDTVWVQCWKGQERDHVFLNGQRRSFTNFHWHLLLRFPLLKTKPSHGEVSGLFALCQTGKHKNWSWVTRSTVAGRRYLPKEAGC